METQISNRNIFGIIVVNMISVPFDCMCRMLECQTSIFSLPFTSFLSLILKYLQPLEISMRIMKNYAFKVFLIDPVQLVNFNKIGIHL